MKKKFNVGISVNINEPNESLFSNGLKQNAITFLETFSKCKNVDKVYFVNFGKQKDLSQSPWKDYSNFIIDFDAAVEKIDLLVAVAVSPSDAMSEILASKNIKIVRDVLGPEYHILTEHLLFDKPTNNVYSRKKNYDAIWLSPHIYPTNKDLFEVIYDCPAYEAPFVWSPKFLEQDVEILKASMKISGLYETKEKEKRVSVFEPNLNVVKTSLTPILAGAKFYNKSPESVKKISLFCANEIKKRRNLIELVKSLDVYSNGKMFFESRYRIAWCLFNHTDIVLSHQRDLALNYLYFDAAWLGFPVVHNAHMVKELGYYYEGFDAEAAADQLVYVAKNFDNEKAEYLKKSREYISKFLPDHPRNVKGYEKLIAQVMKS